MQSFHFQAEGNRHPGRGLRHGDLCAAECPSRDVLKRLTNRPAILLRVKLRAGTGRFIEWHRKVNDMSEKMLGRTLQWVDAQDLLQSWTGRIADAAARQHG